MENLQKIGIYKIYEIKNLVLKWTAGNKINKNSIAFLILLSDNCTEIKSTVYNSIRITEIFSNRNVQ